MEDLVKKINAECGEYGGIPFWSWNDKLEEGELRRQIRGMKELGMGGFFMHARGGLETEYLSDEWFDVCNVCIDEAKKVGMEAWSYDENGWPSGFGGGKLLDNPLNFATYLRMEVVNEYPEIKVTIPPERKVLAIYVDDGNKVKRIYANAPAEKYYVIYQNYDSSYVDTLDARITREFIDCTHEMYKQRNGKDFGGQMPGFFTDEPQYFRYATVWSNTLPEEFRLAYNYDVWDTLPSLFMDYEGAEEHRYDYWNLCHKLFIKNYIKVIYDWCEANGCQVTGHAVEESALSTQMWCCGGVMPFYEFEHMPGVDYLGRGIASDLAFKQLGSVSAQLGKKKTLSEMFGCCGWDVSPTELKKIADVQYASGINVMCHHLYAYSIRGQRKRDYPANYSEHLPWQDRFSDFVNYYNRLGYLLSRGNEKVSTLILHPMHSAYLTYKREIDGPSIADIESGFQTVISAFSDNHIGYHFGDEEIMAAHGSVKGNKLVIGNCSYEYVVIPRVHTIDATSAALLMKYVENGGKILLWDNVPERVNGRLSNLFWLRSNTTFEDIKASAFATLTGPNGDEVLAGVKLMTRDTENGRLFYITNVSGVNYKDAKIILKDIKSVKELKLEQNDWATAPVVDPVFKKCGNDIVITGDLEDGMSRIFIAPNGSISSEPEKVYAARKSGEVVIGGEYNVVSSAANSLTLDMAELSYDGVAYEEKQPIIEIFDKLLRNKYKGDIYLKFSFNVSCAPKDIKMAVEPMRYKSITINGEPVTLSDKWWLDRSFKTADIAGSIKKGKNEVIMSFDYFQRDYVYYVLYGGVSESLRNCLAFDTEIESMYLFGDFGVKTEKDKYVEGPRRSEEYTGEFTITKTPKTIDVSDVVTEGFPFFAGKIEIENTFTLDETAGELYLEGRYSYADVYVNDKFVKRLMFTNHCNISEFTRKGENKLRVLMCNSNRNLLGPHHFADPEPYALGPVVFSLENMWHDGKCDAYRERYAFVKYGFKAIIK